MADHSHQITRRPGRPKGGSDRRQIYTAIKDDIPAILKKLTEQALAGDAQSARILLERSIPVVKAGDIHKEIPIQVFCDRITELFTSFPYNKEKQNKRRGSYEYKIRRTIKRIHGGKRL